VSDPVIPAREVFRNFPGVLIALFYIAATLTMAVSGWGVWLSICSRTLSSSLLRVARFASRQPSPAVT